MFYLYKITNTVNGKVYIGRTNNTVVRWKAHLRSVDRGCQYALARGIRKHGKEAFRFAVLQTYDDVVEVMLAEVAAIVAYDSMNPAKGYNLTPGGEDAEYIAALSVAAKDKRKAVDPEGERTRVSEMMKNMWATFTAEERSAIASKRAASLGLDALSEKSKKAVATLGQAGLAARRRKAAETMGVEGVRRAAAKTLQTLGPEGIAKRAAKIQVANAARTPEQVAESCRKRHETMGPEGRRARAMTRVSRTTREQRLASAAKTKASITPEMRRSMAEKCKVTKQRNLFNKTVEALLEAM